MAPKRVIILGSTGSIGTRALDVIRDQAGLFKVVGLATRGNIGLLRGQVAEFQPEAVAIADGNGAGEGFEAPANCAGVEVLRGARSTVELVERVRADLVLVATVGISGLEPTLAAIGRGAAIALANKEVLVAGGALVMERARRAGVPILPVDSEHNALAQCLRGHSPVEVRRLVLTASGGPFLHATNEQITAATPEQALKHPTWTMGAKITIDSATLMNKGFEVLEAAHLFGVTIDQVDVVIHPGSTVHSLVEFVDGSILAQLGPKDMYLPIQNCLLGEVRRPTPVPRLNLLDCGPLLFLPPDLERFPCLGLAYRAGRAGGVLPAVLNAANEVAVERFLGGEISLPQIPQVVEDALCAAPAQDPLPETPILEEILQWDQWARQRAGAWNP